MVQKLIIIGFPPFVNVFELVIEPSNFFNVAEGIFPPSPKNVKEHRTTNREK
jgi:hypothetical protein